VAAGGSSGHADLPATDRASGTGPAAAAAGSAGTDTGPPARPVHRWRDLDRRSRRWGLAVAAALLLAPIVAFAWFLPDWSPQADPALMGLRALDTGTLRTPLLGQPSQSGVYADSVASVHHPGPLHFYLMALPVRLLGGTVGMLTVSVLVTGTCLVTAAWAVFRQLGRSAGVVAALALAAVAFTTGASSLVNPVSSSIAGYPLLLSAVLLWCIASGDVRLLPAATAAVSFTAQQHLSVVPATAVLVVGAAALLVLTWRREGRWRDRRSRRELARWGRWSGVVALVLWAPVLVQQVFGSAGNLGQMVWFARHSDRESLGLTSAVWQLAHTLGLPPLLGRTDVTGSWLISRPSPATWVSAAAVVAVMAWLCGSRSRRADDPRLAGLGAMVGVVAVAGLVNGSSVPVGLEQARLSFYHWAFALAFFVALVVGLALVPPVRRAVSGRRPAALAGLAVVAVAVPSLVNPALDRRTNTPEAAAAYLDPAVVDRLADGVVAHADDLGEHPLLIARNVPLYLMYRDTLSVALIERGIDVRFPLSSRFFVHDDHLVDRDELEGGLVLVVDDELAAEAPDGELVARADLSTGLDVEAYRALVDAARSADELDLGAELTADLTAAEQALATTVLTGVLDDPGPGLLRTDVLTFLAEHPALAQPALDPGLAADVLASLDALDDGWRPGTATGLRLYAVDRDEMLDVATVSEVGRPR
jgi:hypothetical protein